VEPRSWRRTAFTRARIEPSLQFPLIQFGDHLPRVQPGHCGSAKAIRRRGFATAHRTAQLAATPHSAHQVQSQQILDLSHAQPLLRHPITPLCKRGAGWPRLRLASSRQECSGLRFRSHGGHCSGMADSIPLHPPKCPPSHRNGVRHAAGMLSAITPESCPSWAGARTTPKIVHVHPGILFTFRRNQRSRCRGNLVHHEPEYAPRPFQPAALTASARRSAVLTATGGSPIASRSSSTPCTCSPSPNVKNRPSNPVTTLSRSWLPRRGCDDLASCR
jgi:hypothetical protein